MRIKLQDITMEMTPRDWIEQLNGLRNKSRAIITSTPAHDSKTNQLWQDYLNKRKSFTHMHTSWDMAAKGTRDYTPDTADAVMDSFSAVQPVRMPYDITMRILRDINQWDYAEQCLPFPYSYTYFAICKWTAGKCPAFLINKLRYTALHSSPWADVLSEHSRRYREADTDHGVMQIVCNDDVPYTEKRKRILGTYRRSCISDDVRAKCKMLGIVL